jgi:conjugative element/phage-associated large polyvalent protein
MSQAVIESVAQQRQLKIAAMRERLTLRGRTYQEWVGDEAEKGNAAAVAQLRGWKYQDHRNAAELDTVVASQRDAAHLSCAEDSEQLDWVELTHERLRELRRNEEIIRTIAATKWTINRRSGDVHYNVKGHLALVDRGKTISVLNSEETSIVLGLEMAVKKYGMSIKTEGSDSWKERVARVAAKNDVFVQFTDPMMQQILVQEKMKLDQYGVMANQLAGLRDRVVNTPEEPFQLTSRDTAYIFMGGVSGLRRGRDIVNELHAAIQPGERRTINMKGVFSLEVTHPLDGQPVVFVVRPMAGKGTALADLLNTAAAKMRQTSDSQRTIKARPQKPRELSKKREGIGRD